MRNPLRLLPRLTLAAVVAGFVACSGSGTGGGGPIGPMDPPPSNPPPSDPPPSDPPPAQTGDLAVEISTVGEMLDADGYGIELNGEAAGVLSPDGSIVFEDLPVRSHRIDVTGVAGNCHVNETVPRGNHEAPLPLDVPVEAGATTTVGLTSFCLPPGLGTIYYFVANAFDVMAMDPNGADPRLIDGGSAFEFDLDPAAARIVFDHVSGVMIAAPDGPPEVLTPAAGDNVGGPVFSPDGTRVVYMRSTDDNQTFDLWLVNDDGTDDHALLADGARNMWPSWSPDGQTIVFDRTSADAPAGIFTIPVAGGQPQRLTTGSDRFPAYSNDGTRIAFARSGFLLGNRLLHVMGSDGSGVTMLPQETGSILGLRWSPDDQWIVFSGDRFRLFGDIFVLRVDGSLLVRLTQGVNPRWFP